MKDAFPSKYLKAADLDGKEIAVVIDNLVQEKMNDGAVKLVAYFKGAKKGLVLNKTNAGRIAHRHGDETDEWVGLKIVLYPDTVEMNGEIKDCIRVRTQAPAANPTTARQRIEQKAEADDPGDEPVFDGEPDEIPF